MDKIEYICYRRPSVHPSIRLLLPSPTRYFSKFGRTANKVAVLAVISQYFENGATQG